MSELNEGLKKYLSGFISDHKLKYINEVLEFRIRHLSVILEDIHKSHNASAVIRTCDAVGVQDLHIIENHSKFKINQYVTLVHHNGLIFIVIIIQRLKIPWYVMKS
jgi:tRNA (guanosine-2'-O-)-methyltransferase